jgi:twitching motility protein PilT
MDIKELLQLSIKQGASDMHLSPSQPPVYRVDGDLVPAKDIGPLAASVTKELIYSVMDEDQQKLFESNRELDFVISVPKVSRFRVNSFHQINGIAATFRTITEEVPTLDDLALPPVFKDLLNLPNGLILVTGPTGSGKSTTLAAMVDYINRNHPVHIITVEDPVEYTHQSKKSLINQRQIHKDSLSFEAALRAALREDPDVILLGEMRDLESIRLALTAAETGHLVLATLHTSSAPRSINRIIDVFPAGEKNIIRNLLSESLQAVICQTLVKREEGGRVPAFEIMLGSPAIRNLIREDKVAQMYTSMQTSHDTGMRTLDQYLQELVIKGLISTATAKEAAVNKQLFS